MRRKIRTIEYTGFVSKKLNVGLTILLFQWDQQIVRKLLLVPHTNNKQTLNIKTLFKLWSKE